MYGLKIYSAALVLIYSSVVAAQTWKKDGAGRSEYVQERSECVSDGRKMALSGAELERDTAQCLESKGWAQQASTAKAFCHSGEKKLVCRAGANEEIFGKDQSECTMQVLHITGVKVPRQGWYGIGGLIVSGMQRSDDEMALKTNQSNLMQVCFEGKGWKFADQPNTQSGAAALIATNFADINDIEKLPCGVNCKKQYQDFYLKQIGVRAIALTGNAGTVSTENRVWFSIKTGATAPIAALDECNRASKQYNVAPCKLYSVNDIIVWKPAE